VTALFLPLSIRPQKLTLAQAKLLAYCMVAKIADQDETVGRPIEMEVIMPDGSAAVAPHSVISENPESAVECSFIDRVVPSVVGGGLNG